MKVFATALALLLLVAAPDVHAQVSTNPTAASVLGQTDLTTRTSGVSAATLNGPNGVAVDPTTGKLFVADRTNHRVLRYATEAALQTGAAAEAVLGQDDFTSRVTGTAANRFNSPIGVHVDGAGRLWVADFSNNRVLRFDGASTKATGASADGVLGQATFTTSASVLSASGMRGPVTAYADAAGRVWVTEFSSHRVTRFDAAATKPNGAPADGVSGQPDFVTGTSGLSASSLSSPNGSYVDAAGRLYVSDSGNRRVLRFDAASTTSGTSADGVLGQPDFVTNASNVTREGMTSLRYVFGDSAGRLYVVQEGSHRMTVYENAASRSNGAPADYVFGQPDFETGTAANPPTASSFNTPRAVYVDEARNSVWVADWSNNRVLRFNVPFSPDAALALTAPNGGESLAFGTTYTIRWGSQGVDQVGIEYSTNNGATYSPIATVAAASGQYVWTVPNMSTTMGRVRIYAVGDASLEDVSDAAFSIVAPQANVTLVSPNGYQRWVSGTNRNILFTAQDVPSVDLAYSLDDGQTWTDIVTAYAAQSGSYTWTLPATTSTTARVRVRQTDAPSVSDVSDQAFIIAAGPTGGPQDILFFAGSPTGGFRDASYAAATAPSLIANQGTKLPLSSAFSRVDNYALRFSWTSAVGGTWNAAVATPGFVAQDITAKDTLAFSVFTETTLTSSELPVLFVEDTGNRRSTRLLLSAYSGPWQAGTWTRVRVPVSAFVNNAGTTDLTRVKTVFLGQNEADGQPHTVYLDDVRTLGGEVISGNDRTVIVVIGSSTAAGTGASSAATSWVGLYRSYVQSVDAEARVVNLAVGGYTTYDLMPSNFVPPPGRPSPKPNSNITAALGYTPSAIIVNLPSNDTATGVEVATQMANFRTIRDVARAVGIPIWFSTTQPRNFADDARRQELIAARDSILTQFAPRTINFWNGIATATGTIDPVYNSGDGIHLNDAGHRILYDRVVGAGIIVTVDAEDEASVPSVLALDQNHPNPFGPATSIRFSLPTSTARASLSVYDLLGRRIATLADGPLEAGPHSVRFDASALSSGVYMYRLEAGGQVLSRRMIVAR